MQTAGEQKTALTSIRMATDETPRQWLDGDGNHYLPKVTCKACLAIVERMKRKGA